MQTKHEKRNDFRHKANTGKTKLLENNAGSLRKGRNLVVHFVSTYIAERFVIVYVLKGIVERINGF